MATGGSRRTVSSRTTVQKPIVREHGASTHSLAITDKIKAYLLNHQQVGIQTLRNLFTTWLTSTMTWMVIGIAFALPTILYLLLTNLGNFGGSWDGKPRVSLYLGSEITESEGRKFAAQLTLNNWIMNTRYISAESALAEFEENSSLGDVLASLPGNPLPAVIEIESGSISPAEIKLKLTQLETRQEVERISVDIEWIERLFALLALGERFVTAIGVFLGLGVVLAVGNTIRLAIENRRAEIEIIKLVGGTDRFVRRPFLYLGFWYGIGGALSAWLMVQASLSFLTVPIERLIHSYQNDFILKGLGVPETGVLLLIGAFLGIFGAAVAVGRHLHEIEPS